MDNLTGIILLALRFGLAITLYAFLFLSLLTIWNDIRQQADISTRHTIPPLHLSYLPSGEDPQILKVTLPHVLLGRDPACEYYLENETVSFKHARLSFRLGQWWVKDLGSSNGTFLNDLPVTTPTVITNGDQLRLGQAVVTVAFLNSAE